MYFLSRGIVPSQVLGIGIEYQVSLLHNSNLNFWPTSEDEKEHRNIQCSSEDPEELDAGFCLFRNGSRRLPACLRVHFSYFIHESYKAKTDRCELSSASLVMT